MDNESTLLTPSLMRRLEQLEMTSKRLLVGRLKGERRSKRRGVSVEFADHRPYTEGDDIRFLDWNILVRLDRLFIKLYDEEEDLSLSILVDTSASMGFGSPSKLRAAKELAAALAFVGLVNLDRVTIWPFAERLATPMPPTRGRRGVWRALEFLDNLDAPAEGGGSDLAAACRAFAMRQRSSGVVILISDLLDKNGPEQALRFLLARKMDIQVIQVFSREELDPSLVGDLALVDVEDGDAAEVTISAPLLKRYKMNLDRYLAGVRDFCGKRGIGFMTHASDQPVERLVLKGLRERGVVR